MYPVFLLAAASMPHDCTVSAAMLSVVLLLHEAVNADVDDRICQFSQQWLSEGSQYIQSCSLTNNPLREKENMQHTVKNFCSLPDKTCSSLTSQEVNEPVNWLEFA